MSTLAEQPNLLVEGLRIGAALRLLPSWHCHIVSLPPSPTDMSTHPPAIAPRSFHGDLMRTALA